VSEKSADFRRWRDNLLLKTGPERGTDRGYGIFGESIGDNGRGGSGGFNLRWEDSIT